jgi:hypothetical protein
MRLAAPGSMTRENNERTTFRTLGDVLDETVRLLDEGAKGLRQVAVADSINEREKMVLWAIAEGHSLGADQLRAFKETTSKELKGTWLQYARVFRFGRGLDADLSEARDGGEALSMVDQLDEELSDALFTLSKSYSPPLLACEKAGEMIHQIKKTSARMQGTAADL